MAASLADRAAQLIADFEHAAANNAPITPVMLATVRDLVHEAMLNASNSAAANAKMGQELGAAQQQGQHALTIAQHIQAEASDLVGSIPHLPIV